MTSKADWRRFVTAKELRSRAGYSQGELAEKIGVSAMTVCRWENGKATPSKEQKEKLQQILGLDSGDDRILKARPADREGHKARRPNAKKGEPIEKRIKGAKTTVNNIRELRNRAGLSQGELAEKIGVSAMTVSNWETGKSSPKAEQKIKLQQILGIDSAEDDVPDASPIAAWVTKARNSSGLSVPELAVRSGLTAAAIYRIESGVTRNLHTKTQHKLKQALGPMPEFMAEEAAEEAAVVGLGSLVDFDPHDDDERPSEPGIYVLYDVSERPVYVGEGGNVKKRIRDHEDKFWFKRPIVDNASWIKVEESTLRKQIEEILIKFLKSNAVINKQHVER
jgi:transcriptional regulator with XRE-family HTH domain